MSPISTRLLPTLGPVSGTGMMLNNVLGAGMLSIPGLAARSAGAQSIWSWILAALVVVPLLGVFALLAVRSPHGGGVIHIARDNLGCWGGNVTMALLFSAVILGLPSIALTGGYYAQGAFGLPAWIGACVILATATGANMISARGAARIGAWVSLGVVIFLIVLLACGLAGLDHAFVALPSLPDRQSFAPFALVFFSFAGWEIALGMSEEFRSPARNIPLAIGLSWGLAAVFYLLCAFVVIGNGPGFWNAHPFLDILSHIVGDRVFASRVVALGAVIIVWANLFAALWGVSRMILRSVPLAALRHERNGIPVMAVSLTGAIMVTIVAVATFFSIDIARLISSAGMNFLFIYGLCAIALLVSAQDVIGVAVSALALIVILIVLFATGSSKIYPLTASGLALAVTGGRAMLGRKKRPGR